jgi:hypothetical protein
MSRKPQAYVPGCATQVLIVLAVGIFFCTPVLLVPWLPCPERCWDLERKVAKCMPLATSREHALRMVAWAERFPCPTCGHRKRVSLLPL